MTTKERWEAFKAEVRPYRMLLIWAAVAAVVIGWWILRVGCGRRRPVVRAVLGSARPRCWPAAVALPPQEPPTPTPQPGPGQPTAPELSLNGGTVVPGGRFEFAKIPELVLIRGLPQVVQMGFYQVDPSNPWPAGDVERASGWLSNHPTRLVDAASGASGHDSRLRGAHRGTDLPG